ncbi:MAG: radical SAM protein [Candidatus Omnitrophota bacterium]
MRILLTNMPWREKNTCGVRAGSRWPHIKDRTEARYLPFPFFLAYAAALLKKNGFDVTIIDAIAEEIREEEFLKKVQAIGPDLIVAETAAVSLNNDMTIIGRIDARIKVALAGPEVAIRTKEFLKKNTRIDLVLRGEYEYTLLELACAMRDGLGPEGISGVNFRGAGGRIIKNADRPLIEDLDALPWPLRDGLPMERYNDTPGGIPMPSAQMIASRGCPHGCTFCLWPQVMYGGRNYRTRSPDDVVREMKHLTGDLGFRSVYFDDDTFGLNRGWLKEFIREMREADLNIPWAMMTRPDSMDRDILNELKGLGLCAVKYGFESADQDIVNKCGKKLDLLYAKDIIAYTKSLGIKVHLTFMFGLPGETRKTIKETIDLALGLDPHSAQFSIATPFPGTRYFTELYDPLFAKRSHKGLAKKGAIKDRAGEGRADILLVLCPPWDITMPPLGISYLSSYLKHKGYRALVFDANIYLFNTVNHEYRRWWNTNAYELWVHERSFDTELSDAFGDRFDELAEEIISTDTKCIGFSVHYANRLFTVELARRVRKRDRTRVMIFGGPGCSTEEQRALIPQDIADVFVVGEGEEALAEVLKDLHEKGGIRHVPGTIINEKGPLSGHMPRQPIADLDTMTFPTFEEFHLDLFTLPRLPLLTSRGCIGRCSFCNDHGMLFPYRQRTARHVMEEIRYHAAHNKVANFSLKDLLCNGNARELELLCDMIIKEDMKIVWDSQAIPNRSLTRRLLAKMKKAGCNTLIYGVESCSDNVLRRMRKSFTKKDVSRVLKNTKRAGIKAFINIIVGFPGESESDFMETYDFIKRHISCINAVSSLNTCLVNYGSDLQRRPQKYNIAAPEQGGIDSMRWQGLDGNTFELREERLGKISKLFSDFGVDCGYSNTSAPPLSACDDPRPIRRARSRRRSKFEPYPDRPACDRALSPRDLAAAREKAYLLWEDHCRRRGDYRYGGPLHKLITSLRGFGAAFTLIKVHRYMKCRSRAYSSLSSRIAKLKNIKEKARRYLHSRLTLMGVLNGSAAYLGPHMAQLDVTDNCNNSCIGCWCNSPLLGEDAGKAAGKHLLPLPLVKSLIDDLHALGTREIYIAGGGEPFMHPHITQIIKYIKEKKMSCALNTNFTLVEDRMIDELIALEVDQITVSVWAGDAKTYAATHPGKDGSIFYRLRDLLKRLALAKSGRPKPFVKIYNVISNINHREISAMIDFAVEVKADAIEFAVIDTIPHKTDVLLLSKEERDEVLDQFNKAKDRIAYLGEYGKLEFSQLPLFLKRLSSEDALRGEYDRKILENTPCYAGWLFTRIMADGNVIGCLKAHRIPVGNLHKERFPDIWNGQRQAYFRMKTKSARKEDPAFALIGNDPNSAIGCFRGCDNIGRNMEMYRRIQALTIYEKGALYMIENAMRFMPFLKGKIVEKEQ